MRNMFHCKDSFPEIEFNEDWHPDILGLARMPHTHLRALFLERDLAEVCPLLISLVAAWLSRTIIHAFEAC